MRTATSDTAIRGVPVAAGDPVLLVYASANRDEEVFGPDAGELRVDRHPNPHVSFGFGPHFCLGAALARLEGRVVLGQLLDRFETVSLAGTGRADAESGDRRRPASGVGLLVARPARRPAIGDPDRSGDPVAVRSGPGNPAQGV